MCHRVELICHFLASLNSTMNLKDPCSRILHTMGSQVLIRNKGYLVLRLTSWYVVDGISITVHLQGLADRQIDEESFQRVAMEGTALMGIQSKFPYLDEVISEQQACANAGVARTLT